MAAGTYRTNIRLRGLTFITVMVGADKVVSAHRKRARMSSSSLIPLWANSTATTSMAGTTDCFATRAKDKRAISS